jgi:hypothetical protein
MVAEICLAAKPQEARSKGEDEAPALESEYG